MTERKSSPFEILDVRDIPCPFHYFKAKEKLLSLEPEQILEVWSTKLGAAEIEKHFQEEGYEVVATMYENDVFKVQVRKKS